MQTDQTSDRIFLGSKVYLSNCEPVQAVLTSNLAIFLRRFEKSIIAGGLHGSTPAW